MKIINEPNPDMIWYSRQVTGVPPVPNVSVAYSIAKEAGLNDAKAKAFAKWVTKKRYSLEDIRKEVQSTKAIYCPCILGQNLRIDFNHDPNPSSPYIRRYLSQWFSTTRGRDYPTGGRKLGSTSGGRS